MDQDSLFGDEQRHQPLLFDLPDGGTISAAALGRADRETQIDVMRYWFGRYYEDPAENTPYQSAEGGYIYIWGGPYDAKEELEGEFSGVVPDEVIEELAAELSHISWEWTGHPDSSEGSDEFDNYLYQSIAAIPDHFKGFKEGTVNIRRLLEVKAEAADRQLLLRLLYSNAITLLETYLSGIVISSINVDPTLARKLVETTPEFQATKITLSEVFKESETINQKIEKYLSEFMWHRLEKAKPMFRDTLGVEFPHDMKELFQAILVRHDLVHRNGTKKGGGEHVLQEGDVLNLIDAVEKFVSEIEAKRPYSSQIFP